LSTLQTIQQQAKVGAIYVMDRDGLTLGASNWDQPLGFVGKNFSYRPYFDAALHGRAGRFYGIGTSTSEAGYFIAQPVYGNGSAGGPVTAWWRSRSAWPTFERTWRNSDDAIVLADQAGVIFLSNRPDWIYRSLHVAGRGDRTRTGAHPAIHGPARDAAQRPSGFVRHAIGWRAGLAVDAVSAPVARAAHRHCNGRWRRPCCCPAWRCPAGPCTSAEGGWRSGANRARRCSGPPLKLNDKIVERTQQLRTTNQHLESKYAKLQETEHHAALDAERTGASGQAGHAGADGDRHHA
jgi:two-component system C4-dicarboxylate transport sensor histidine kinase DctB